MNSNIAFIPGWMKSVAYYGATNGRNIWHEPIESDLNFNASIVVAHSLGCPFACEYWQKHPETKVILINPLIPKRNIGRWMWRWFRFALAGHMNRDQRVPIQKLWYAFGEAVRWSKVDLVPIIKTMPQGQIVVVRGKNDHFFCDDEAKRIITTCDVQVIEIDGLGHEWDERYSEIIDKVIR